MQSSRHPVSLPSLVRGRAAVDVDLMVLVRQEPQWQRELAVRGLVLFAGLVLLQPVLLVAGAILFIPVLRRYWKVVALMQDGEVLPAKLVSVDPPLVAAYGDLSRGFAESRPVIVVFQVPPSSFTGVVQRGDRVPVVGRGRGGDSSRFGSIEMRLISTVTDRPDVLSGAIASVPEWDWESLDEALFDLSANPEAGVYAVS